MFEHKRNTLIPFSLFLGSVIKYLNYSLILIGLSWLIGVCEYHHYADLDWITSYYNATIILIVVGFVSEITNVSAKLSSFV